MHRPKNNIYFNLEEH